MAKEKLNIEVKIKKLEAIQNVLEHIDNEIKWAKQSADDYLEQSKDDEGTVDEDCYSYRSYLTAQMKVEALESLREEVEDLAD